MSIAVDAVENPDHLEYNGQSVRVLMLPNEPNIIWKDKSLAWPNNTPANDDNTIQQNAPLKYWFKENIAHLGGHDYALSDLLSEDGTFSFNDANEFITYLFLRFGANFTFAPANVYYLPTVANQVAVGEIQSIFDNNTAALARFKLYIRGASATTAEVLVTNTNASVRLGTFTLGQPLRIAYALMRKTETSGPNAGRTYTYFTGAVNGEGTYVLTTPFVPFEGVERSVFLNSLEGDQEWSAPPEDITAASWLDAVGFHDYNAVFGDVNLWASRASMQDPFTAETPIPFDAPQFVPTADATSFTADSTSLTADSTRPTG